MNEKQRNEYLEAMGVPVFVPRFQLPCAARSVQAPLPPPVSTDRENISQVNALAGAFSGDELSSREQKPRGSATAASSFVQSVLADAKVAPKKVEVKEIAAEVASGQDDQVVEQEPMLAPFSLSLWQFGNLLIVDQRKPAAGLPTQLLLQNILASLDIQLQHPSPEILQWPVGGGSQPSKLSEAKMMVDGFLMGRYAKQPFSKLWLLGEVAHQVVAHALQSQADDQVSKQANKPFVTLQQFQARALLLPSLHDMLVKPGNKAVFWQLLSQHHFD